MIAHLLRHSLQATITLILASFVIFLTLRLVPGDPALVIAGPDATEVEIAAVRTRLGLDRPLGTQYLLWIQNVLRGDLGRSYVSRIPVTQLLLTHLPATLELTVVTLALVILVGIPFGVYSGVRSGSRLDSLLTSLASLGIGIPNFWIGIMLVLAFSVYLNWLPPSGRIDPMTGLLPWAKTILMPALSLALYHGATLARFVRTEFIDVSRKDFIRTARAKGVPEKDVIWRHSLRNVLISTVTILGITAGRMLGGAVIVESVFGWPGVGRMIVQALLNRDYPVVQGCLLLFTLTFIVVNFIVDILYGLIDPRVTLHGSKNGAK